MPTNTQIDMSALSPALHLDLPFMYGPSMQSHAETVSSSDTTSPIMDSFDMPLVSDFDTLPTGIYPSPISSPATTCPLPTIKQEDKGGVNPSTAKSTPTHKPTPKRKRENRYKNAPPSVLSRRRAQNRASQRAYRERKDQRIRDLEGMLEDYKQKHEALSQAYASLHVEVLRHRSAHAETHPQSAMAMGAPFGSPTADSTPPNMDVLPIVDGWQFFPGMGGYPV